MNPSRCTPPSPKFEDFRSGNGAPADRDIRAHVVDYDQPACKLDFERYFRTLVLLHTTERTSAHDLTDAAEEAPLFNAIRSDLDISVSDFGDAMAHRPTDPEREPFATEEIGSHRSTGN